MNDQLQTTIAEILKALQSGAETYGPKAFELAIQLKRIDGAQQIGWGVFGLLILLVTGWFIRKIINHYRPYRNLTPTQEARRESLRAMGYSARSSAEDREFAQLSGEFDFMEHPEIMLTLFLLIPIGVGSSYAANLFDLWNWTAVFAPELALAHDVLLKLTNR